MSQKYLVADHEIYVGAMVKVVTRAPGMHMVVVQAIEPHVKLPRGERFTIDMRKLTCIRDTKFTDPKQMPWPKDNANED